MAPLWILYHVFPSALRATLVLKLYRRALDRLQSGMAKPFSFDRPRLKTWDAAATPSEQAFVKRQFLRYSPHVVIANYAFLSNVFCVLPRDKSLLRVIITHEVRHQRVLRFMEKHMDLFYESEVTRQEEEKQLRKADLLIAIHDEDMKSLAALTSPCEVLSVPMPAVCQPTPFRQMAGRCLFVGSGANHNVHSLRWFLEKVWPIVLDLVPYSSLHVCGTVCDTIKQEIQNVSFLGRVDDLRVEYSTAEVCLVPLVVGSGLKIKLVEALSYGRACVSTPVGLEGIGEIAGTAVMVAESPEGFAKAVQLILTRPDKRRHMQEQAHKFIRERLSPEVVYQPFIDRIYRHLAKSMGE